MFIFIVLIVWNTDAQSNFNPEDYGVWENIYNGDISNDGNWIFYESRYQMDADTLKVQSTNSKKKYQISKGRAGKFTKESQFFVVMSENNTLQIIDLKTGETSNITDAKYYILTQEEDFLVVIRSKKDTSELLIKNLLTGSEFTIPNVKEFLIHPNKNEIALILEEDEMISVAIMDFVSQNSTTLIAQDNVNYNSLAWSENKTLVFLEVSKEDNPKVKKIYSCHNQKCKQLDVFNNLSLPEKFQVETNFLDISKKGDLIYFKGKMTNVDSIAPQGVQIWDTADKWIYPKRKLNNLLQPPPTLWYWNSDKNIVAQITDTTLTEMIKVNEDYVLKYDKLAYEPQYRYVPDVDMYLHNLKSGKGKLLLKKQRPDKVFINPNGEAIVFFKDESWWVHNLKDNTIHNLTKDLPYSFIDKENDRNDQKTAFSRRIKWLEDERAILVSDEYDIWKLSLDGKFKQILTAGREIKRQYRLFMDFSNPKNSDQNTVNSKTGILFHATDEKRNSGYFLYKDDEALTTISFGAFQADEIKWDSTMQYISYRVQSYDMPPKIITYDVAMGSNTTLVTSNSHNPLKNWGTSKLLEFAMKDGSLSKAVLIYPTDYDPSKKYPMVLDIYERATEYMHEFHPISWYSSIGFNPTHYALDGYFVLLPDIAYEIGNPGKSALRFVDEAINHVLQIASIDKNKIGLFGFSYGGYESAYIVTQTDRFAAVVAGAAATDLVTYYHTINWNLGQEEMFRLENYQMRMGDSYFNSKKNYINNSPFHHIENISTPLLLFSGGDDLHVDYNQSIRFYLALRRLKKDAQLLLFEGEGHGILDLEKRRYLSESIKRRFDTYCKPIQ